MQYNPDIPKLISPKRRYMSDISKDAEAKPLPHDPFCADQVEFWLDGKMVGVRHYSDGKLSGEVAYRDGVRHGREYDWWMWGPRRLSSASRWVNGKEDGTAYQWYKDGRVMGSYTMVHGTGWDIWFQECCGETLVHEARYYVDGLMHGREWWFSFSGNMLTQETFWHHGDKHGVEREWNSKGRVKRGFPQYWIHNVQVDKRRYMRAVLKDPTLPPFRAEDCEPWREFPPEVAKQLVRDPQK